MLQGYFRMAAIDGVYWSLTYELGFYFLMYLIFRIGGAKYIEAIPLYMMAGAIAFYQFSPWIPHPLHYLFMINPYAHLFGGGMAFFLIYQDRVTVFRLLAILLVPLIQYLYSGVDGLIAGLLCIGLMAWGTSAIDPFGLKARQGRVVQALVGLGAISYALYLTHQMIGYVAIGWLNQMGVSTDIAVGITLIGAIILAWVLTNGVEKPSAAYLKRILPKNIDLLATWTKRKTS
jgi:peptidoglycan/LPS O-acetylase OafA/YrhL